MYRLSHSTKTPVLGLLTQLRVPAPTRRSVLAGVGRRPDPLPFVRGIIDAMSYTKRNALHLHLSDFGRFAWESRVFPELNVGYRGDGAYWKQEEVRALIESTTYPPLVVTQGLTFCNLSFPAVLYDDPAGNSGPPSQFCK
jgi:hypothetical protein